MIDSVACYSVSRKTALLYIEIFEFTNVITTTFCKSYMLHSLKLLVSLNYMNLIKCLILYGSSVVCCYLLVLFKTEIYF